MEADSKGKKEIKVIKEVTISGAELVMIVLILILLLGIATMLKMAWNG